MRWEAGYLLGMALQSVPEPRKVARDLFAEGLSQRVLWHILALILVISTMLTLVISILAPAPEGAPAMPFSPLTLGLGEAAITVLSVFLIDRIGRAFGGTGSFYQALVTVTWLAALNLLLSLTMVALSLIAPAMALLLLPVGMLALFWILTMFITELHGFATPGMVAAGIIVSFLTTIFVLVFILSIAMALLGIAPDPNMIGSVQ